jgi:hypothetical protein
LTIRERLRLNRLGRISDDLPSRPGLTTRDVHRKTHSCLAGELRIDQNLPADLAVGVFEPEKTYDAVVRFSNGDPQARNDVRGMAVKLLAPGALPFRQKCRVVKQLIDDQSGKPINPDEINRNGILDIVTINYPVFLTILGWIQRLMAIPAAIRSDPDHLRAMIARTLNPGAAST